MVLFDISGRNDQDATEIVEEGVGERADKVGEKKMGEKEKVGEEKVHVEKV